jgi:hypothetical protein
MVSYEKHFFMRLSFKEIASLTAPFLLYIGFFVGSDPSQPNTLPLNKIQPFISHILVVAGLHSPQEND